MKKVNILPVAVLLLAAVCGVIYALQLMHGFEPDTGFAVEEDKYIWIKNILSVAAAALYAVLCSRLPVRREIDWRSALFPPANPYVGIGVTTAFLMLVTAGLSFYAFINDKKYACLVIALLSVLAAVSFWGVTAAQKRGKTDDNTNLFMTAPIFWACIMFMFIARDNVINPVIPAYADRLLAALFSMLALYLIASLYFKKTGVKKALFFSMIAAHFVFLFILGKVIASFAGGIDIDMPAYEIVGIVSACLFVIRGMKMMIDRTAKE